MQDSTSDYLILAWTNSHFLSKEKPNIYLGNET